MFQPLLLFSAERVRRRSTWKKNEQITSCTHTHTVLDRIRPHFPGSEEQEKRCSLKKCGKRFRIRRQQQKYTWLPHGHYLRWSDQSAQSSAPRRVSTNEHRAMEFQKFPDASSNMHTLDIMNDRYPSSPPTHSHTNALLHHTSNPTWQLQGKAFVGLCGTKLLFETSVS